MALGCCLVLAVTSLAGETALSGLPGAVGGLPGAVGGLPGPSLRVLQLNLCDSGLAGCYTGRAVRAAAEVVRGERPDVVTLNEVCRDDVSRTARNPWCSAATSTSDPKRDPACRPVTATWTTAPGSTSWRPSTTR